MTDEKPEAEGDEYIRELRSEAKNYRLRLRESEQRVEALETELKGLSLKEKTDLEKLIAENTTLKDVVLKKDESIARVMVDAEIKSRASSMDVVDIDTVAKLIDRSQIGYVDGEIQGIDKALKNLVKEKPFLVKEREVVTPGAGGEPITEAPKGFQGALLASLQAEKERRKV